MLLIEDMVKNFLFIDICYIGKVLFSIKTKLERDQNKWHLLQQVKVAVIKKFVLGK